MALRTIADLPALIVDGKVNDERFMEKLGDSLFEISYKSDPGYDNTYISKHVKFVDLSGLLMNALVNRNFDFYGHKTFRGGISSLGASDLSGDFYVNRDAAATWRSSRAEINAGNAAFNSLTAQVSAETLTAYTTSGAIKDYDGSNMIANWSSDNFTVSVLFRAGDISCTGQIHTFNAVMGGADLAEMYKSDEDYPVGTLVRFGGDAEITISKDGAANAVITDRPGAILNGKSWRDGIYKGIALIGRTPVRAHGRIRRFDRLGADPFCPGIARVAQEHDNVIAIALEDAPSDGINLVQCAV